MTDNNQYREMYVSEALEHVEIMNGALLKLEEKPSEREYIDLVFRSAHTIKGMSATMGYDQTRELCKNVENVFDMFRQGEEKPTQNIISVILKCIDLLQSLIQDENKKVDLKPYLDLLHNPDSVEESTLVTETSNSIGKSPTIRVKMEDLDNLVNLVGELVISNMVLEQAIVQESIDKTRQVMTTLNRLVGDLHYQSMKLRLVPIDEIFNRFSRIVRDLSKEMKKEIKLKTDSGGLDLDRTVLDVITDPLLHMIRNCIDHGMELPEERTMAGKQNPGTINLTAYRIGDKVAIRIDDDGKGIDVDAVKRKAIEKKLITEDEARDMPKESVLALLGTPGLSTAKKVTDVSGRGVGMDVVISQVESVGGTVKIETEKGKGTSITLIIPLTLSIIGGLLINVANQKYVLPLSSITTTVNVSRDEIKRIHGKEVITLREKIIPLIYVDETLGYPSKRDSEKVTVIIVEKLGAAYGLVVDSFDRKQDIVIKPLGTTADKTSQFTNATILADGSVALILDPSVFI